MTLTTVSTAKNNLGYLSPPNYLVSLRVGFAGSSIVRMLSVSLGLITSIISRKSCAIDLLWEAQGKHHTNYTKYRGQKFTELYFGSYTFSCSWKFLNTHSFGVLPAAFTGVFPFFNATASHNIHNRVNSLKICWISLKPLRR